MRTLMVVDDEFNIRNGLVISVPWETIGVKVVAQARDGAEALDLARQFHPDLVVTDISMDEMDGLEFTTVLLKELPRTKVIILSGYGEFAYAQRALDLKVSAYLLKPVSPEDLLVKVAEVVKEWESDRERARRLGEDKSVGEEAVGDRAVIRRARDYLESRFGDHETCLESLAGHLGLTPGYISKLFKAETGRNYTEELADLRIKKAKELLSHSNLKLSEVGVRVGYLNPQYFATAFRKATGMTPSEYRENPR
jgi:YesN/AraC family two-component response regulator